MYNKEQIWVSPDGEGWWRVHKNWSQRDVAHFDSKKDAVSRATTVAQNQKIEMKIQKRNGQIHWGNSYWSNPFPPKRK